MEAEVVTDAPARVRMEPAAGLASQQDGIRNGTDRLANPEIGEHVGEIDAANVSSNGVIAAPVEDADEADEPAVGSDFDAAFGGFG